MTRHITIKLDDEYHKEIKEVSVKTGIPFTTIIKQGIKLRMEQLEKQKQKNNLRE